MYATVYNSVEGIYIYEEGWVRLPQSNRMCALSISHASLDPVYIEAILAFPPDPDPYTTLNRIQTGQNGKNPDPELHSTIIFLHFSGSGLY